MGLKGGMADFLLIDIDGRHYWLELKRAGGSRVSEAQTTFAAMLRFRNVPYAIVYGYDDAIAQLKRWGTL
jgi:hypothetical protein